MVKKTIHITESELKEIINEQINRIIEEGIDIDIPSRTVGFNPNHQEYVDTNDPWNPQPFYNEISVEACKKIIEENIEKGKIFLGFNYDLVSRIQRYARNRALQYA